MENEQCIESGLSVGTTKIANKYEIFTEEEVDIINNKIPELDERVSIIEYEIEDINSSLDEMANEKATRQEVDIERKRIDNLAKLKEGSTTGDAELIDGRIGANGLIYSNIGNAIRNQIKDQNDKINFYQDRTMYLESITSALEGSDFSVNSLKIENLLNISGYQYNREGLTISIKDNVIYVDGVANDFYYIKLTNGFDVGFGGSGGNKKAEWCNEKYTLTLNEKYHLASYIIDGIIEYVSPDQSTVIASARNSNYTSILSHSKGLVELTEELSYIQLYIPPATYNKCKIGVVLQKDELSTKFTPNGYYDTTVDIGNAIRNQIKDQNDRIMYLESITSALEGSTFSINSVKIENLLSVDGYEYNKDGLSISIKDNVIYVDGILNDYCYIKITNGFDIGFGPSGGNKKAEWCNEKYTLPLNEKYHLNNYKIDGYIENYNPDSPPIISARNSNYTSILSSSKGLVELTEELSYIQFFIPPATYNKCRFGIVLQKDTISTKFTPNGYYDTTINIVDNNIVKDVPNNIIANSYKEIVGTYFNAIQGACSDGKYIYYGIVNNQTDDDNTVGKMDINTKEIIKTTNELNLGHCNSMTYCSYDGYIHCVSLDEESTIHRITTDLEYIDSYEVSILDKYPQFTGFGAIDYNEKTEQFIFLIRGNKKGYAIFTKNMTFVKIIWCEYVESHVYGGVCSDNNFIYQAICGNNFEGIISIFNFNGDLIKTIQIENFNGEIEEPFLVKNKMYCSACRHDYTNHDIWELSLKNYQII